jgi:hypothetical protein
MTLRTALGRTLAGLAVITLVACSDDEPSRNDEGAIEEEGDVSAFDLEVGDCFEDPAGIGSETGATVVDLGVVPCDQPHDNEVFGLVELEGGDDEFPGDATVSEQGRAGCLAKFEPYVGLDYETSTLDFDALLTPTEETWNAGDREVVCGVYNVDLSPLTGSVKGSAK